MNGIFTLGKDEGVEVTQDGRTIDVVVEAIKIIDDECVAKFRIYRKNPLEFIQTVYIGDGNKREVVITPDWDVKMILKNDLRAGARLVNVTFRPNEGYNFVRKYYGPNSLREEFSQTNI